MSRRRTLTIGIAATVILIGAVLIGRNGRLVQGWARHAQIRMHRIEFKAAMLKDDLELKKREWDEARFIENVESGKIVAIQCPIALVSTGDWMRKVEGPICAFAQTNRIEILRFRSWPNTNWDVCVWKKDAGRMRAFVDSLKVADLIGGTAGLPVVRTQQ